MQWGKSPKRSRTLLSKCDLIVCTGFVIPNGQSDVAMENLCGKDVCCKHRRTPERVKIRCPSYGQAASNAIGCCLWKVAFTCILASFFPCFLVSSRPISSQEQASTLTRTCSGEDRSARITVGTHTATSLCSQGACIKRMVLRRIRSCNIALHLVAKVDGVATKMQCSSALVSKSE